MAKKIEIEITGDTKSLEKALSKAQKSAGGFEKGLSTAAKGAGIALAGIGVGAVFAVRAASDLGEQMSKTSVVFAESAKGVQRWSEGTASAFGISQRAALEAAGTFGNMLVPMGFARDKAAEMSTNFVELAADMASFNNASPEETLDALRAGLAGETEPLRRFGVFLNEARIQQKALDMGLVKGKEKLDANAKATATYAIIMEDTADTQGDFGRTSDSLANQQRILKAELEDTAAALGTALLPAATAVAGVLLDLVNVVKENEDAAKIATVAIGGLAAGLILANASLKIYTAQSLLAIGATQGLRLAMAATPWGLAAVAASTLVAFIISQGNEAEDASVQQDRLTEAVRDYQEAIKAGNNARKEYAESSRRVEGAEIAVRRAVQARREVDKAATSTTLDKREADLRVSSALAELRDAEDAAEASGTKLRNEQERGIGAKNRARVAVERLADEFRNRLVPDSEAGRRAQARLGKQYESVSDQAARGRRNAETYADKLRAMAATLDDSQDSLRRTARLAATLADAWGRVVSLPAAREFVARFRVFTTVETNRVVPGGPRQAGGPVMAGRAYIVGERRPEVFVPNESGRIIPRVSQVTGGASNGAGSSGPMQLALVAVGPDILRQLRELDRRARLGGAPA